MSVHAATSEMPGIVLCPSCSAQTRHVRNRRGPKTWVVNARSHREGRLWVRHDHTGAVIAQELAADTAKAFVSAEIPLYREHECEETG